MIKVRFAPSPTGYLHIGGARTALFNWMYARAQGGKFVLRIEDTDLQRSGPEFVDEILDSMQWLGFDWDELFFQSKRFDIYRGYSNKLLLEDKAYKDGDAVILKMIPREVKIFDLIRGEIVFDTGTIKDQVLMKSDGSPTYSFACVVDDALMEISHVIRGEDHISNTPKQMAIYQALDFKVPKFAHLPLILSEDGNRLSKRTGAVAVSDYQRKGFLPEALVNYLMLLGWSPGDNREVIDLNAAVKKFSIKKVNKAAASFSIKKLKWLNGQYIKKMDVSELTDNILLFLKVSKSDSKEGVELKSEELNNGNFDRQRIQSIVNLFKGRLQTLSDFWDWAGFAFLEEVPFDDDVKQKFFTSDYSGAFAALAESFSKLDSFESSMIEQSFGDVSKGLNMIGSDLIQPLRIALTGRAAGPELFKIIALLGKDKTVNRLKKVI